LVRLSLRPGVHRLRVDSLVCGPQRKSLLFRFWGPFPFFRIFLSSFSPPFFSPRFLLEILFYSPINLFFPHQVSARSPVPPFAPVPKCPLFFFSSPPPPHHRSFFPPGFLAGFYPGSLDFSPRFGIPLTLLPFSSFFTLIVFFRPGLPLWFCPHHLTTFGTFCPGQFFFQRNLCSSPIYFILTVKVFVPAWPCGIVGVTPPPLSLKRPFFPKCFIGLFLTGCSCPIFSISPVLNPSPGFFAPP